LASRLVQANCSKMKNVAYLNALSGCVSGSEGSGEPTSRSLPAFRVVVNKELYFVGFLATDPVPLLSFIVLHIVDLTNIFPERPICRYQLLFVDSIVVAHSKRSFVCIMEEWTPAVQDTNAPVAIQVLGRLLICQVVSSASRGAAFSSLIYGSISN